MRAANECRDQAVAALEIDGVRYTAMVTVERFDRFAEPPDRATVQIVADDGEVVREAHGYPYCPGHRPTRAIRAADVLLRHYRFERAQLQLDFEPVSGTG